MDKDNINNQNEQSKDEKQPSDDTQLEYREISEEELKQILEDHKKWLESDEKEGEKADLQRANLQYINFSGANLQKANLKEANLQKANLSKANLQKAILKDTNLQKANLSEANLQKAFLYKANLQKAILKQANLQKANLYKANLQKANFYRANLQKAILDRANLQKAIFNKANLQKTILDGTNLQKANFSNANLQKAFLYRAYLQKANFIESNLQKAYLIEANLSNADLYKAELQNTALNRVKGLNVANVQYANLEGATGLLGNEFAQADVTGTKIPVDIKEFKSLEIVKETSQNARKIFFAMLLGCVYSWLTIATTKDLKLLTNTASSPLPIIGTEIPIAWFYITAPLVLICLYFYFHLYLLKLWEGLAGLPAKFPDGKRLDERAYPWLLNGLVRRHFRLLKNERPFIAHIQEWITIFLGWWVVPITMIAFWLRYIPRHDWFGTCFHIGLIVVSIAFVIIFYRLCAFALQGEERVSFSWDNCLKDIRFFYGLIVLTISILFTFLSYGAIEGHRLGKPDFKGFQYIVPWAFNKIGYDVFVDFREKELSKKPDNYWQLSEKQQPKSVKGINLRKTNLNSGDLSQTFLIKADIRDASLCYTNLSKANLQYADFTNSKLKGADLRGAQLYHTELKNADLREADLTGIDLIVFEWICKAKTVYKAKMDDKSKNAFNKFCPTVLEKPTDE